MCQGDGGVSVITAWEGIIVVEEWRRVCVDVCFLHSHKKHKHARRFLNVSQYNVTGDRLVPFFLFKKTCQ